MLVKLVQLAAATFGRPGWHPSRLGTERIWCHRHNVSGRERISSRPAATLPTAPRRGAQSALRGARARAAQPWAALAHRGRKRERKPPAVTILVHNLCGPDYRRHTPPGHGYGRPPPPRPAAARGTGSDGRAQGPFLYLVCLIRWLPVHE